MVPAKRRSVDPSADAFQWDAPRPGVEARSLPVFLLTIAVLLSYINKYGFFDNTLHFGCRWDRRLYHSGPKSAVPMSHGGGTCSLRGRRLERRGWAWVIGAFAICPCHLPVTLAVIAGALSGTAMGARITGHPYIVGGAVTGAWLAASWRGVLYLRSSHEGRGSQS